MDKRSWTKKKAAEIAKERAQERKASGEAWAKMVEAFPPDLRRCRRGHNLHHEDVCQKCALIDEEGEIE